ncbi:MAG: HlyC/CorC family transporter [Burkholderiales bacterium]|nr:HlyC/CorC family transporter [Burkholderiales bacterium]
MNDIPLQTLLIALFFLLLVSGFFSIAETSMMALNRYRLRHLVSTGNRGAMMAAALLDRTDRLLGVVLLGNNFFNSLSAALFTVIMFRTLGENEWALWIGSAGVTFCILVLAEITPKIIGATYPERIALASSYVLTPLLRVAWPIVWFVNLFVQTILWTLRLKPRDEGAHQMTPEELRTLVLEGGQYIPQKHRSILVNLFELERVTVDDVMIPRGQVEWLDLDSPPEQLLAEIATCYHTRLVVCRSDLNNVVGILHVRRALSLVRQGRLAEAEDIEALLAQPYFVPGGTALFTQLANFQEQHERIGLIVDEYGELQGLVTLEDILEELVGEFTTTAPGRGDSLLHSEDGSVLVEGSATLRSLNRKLGLKLPLDGPKTLNGLIVEYLRELPEPGTTVKIAGHPLEVVQTQERSIRSVRVHPRVDGGSPDMPLDRSG